MLYRFPWKRFLKRNRWILLIVVLGCYCSYRLLIGIVSFTFHKDSPVPLSALKTFQTPFAKYVNFSNQYRFIINHPDVCGLEDISLVFVIHSACHNFERRKNVRRTWGSVKKSHGFNIRLFFMLGKVDSYQEMVAKESAVEKDIIQQDFVDAYRNLTLKNQMAMKWPVHYCKTAQFIVKTDDDVMVNVFHLTRFLQMKKKREPSIKDFLMCNVFKNEYPHRYGFPFPKWKLTYEEYPFDIKFPDFCQGIFYILSPDAAWKLWRGSYELPPLFVDDVFMTGFVRQHMNIAPRHGKSPYKMSSSLANAYKPESFVADALSYLPTSVQMFNWMYAWNVIVEHESRINNQHDANNN